MAGARRMGAKAVLDRISNTHHSHFSPPPLSLPSSVIPLLGFVQERRKKSKTGRRETRQHQARRQEKVGSTPQEGKGERQTNRKQEMGQHVVERMEGNRD